MRIALVNYEYPGVTSNAGGGGRVTELLAGGLRERGHRVKVVTDESDGHYATFPLRSYRRLQRELQEFDPDVVNGHFSIPSSLTLPLVTDAPVVISIMGADVYDPTRFRALRPLTRRINKRLFESSEYVIAPSTDLAVRAVAGDYDARIIPYGIDASAWNWRARELDGPIELLSVCRLVERKNLETAIEAVKRLREFTHDVRYRIVGIGPKHHDLKREAWETDWLEIAGYVTDLQAAYDRADVFFLPSKHEAFGMVFLEALACGLPVVTSDTGGQTDFITDAVGRTAPHDSPSQLANALATVLREYESYQRVTHECISTEYSVGRMVSAYERTFREVADVSDTTRQVRPSV